jgi:kynurenine formamidase
MHIGTHIDGRMHMLDVNESIGDIPIDTFCGKAGIIRSEKENIISMKACYSEIIKGKTIILFHTGMDKYYGEERYYKEHPVLDLSICHCLAENKIRMIGLDMPSPDRIPFQVHKYLLNNNIYIIENLTNLDKIADTDQFEVFAFPLKIHADSSMARVVARISRA